MRFFLISLTAFCLTLHAQDEALAEKIRAILQERIDAEATVGIVAGVFDEKGMTVAGIGKTALENGMPIDGNTVFEIGSITKVFTVLNVLKFVHEGTINLDDSCHLQGAELPTKDGKKITWRHLLQHTSGLPRLPDNMLPKDSRDPYADYGIKELRAFLKGCKLQRVPGDKYEYSNLGSAIAASALPTSMDYELFTRSVFATLKMRNTVFEIPSEEKKSLEPGFVSLPKITFAMGHDELLRPTPYWTFKTFAGAGGIRSTANDLLKFVSANIQPETTKLGALLKMTQDAPRMKTSAPNLEIALGWHVLKTKDSEIFWHNGGTGGFRSWIGFDRKSKRGAVVLSNAAIGVDDIGQHLVDQKLPLTPQKKAVRVPAATLDKYVGEFQLAPNFNIVFTREGEHLSGQATGQPKFAMRPKSQTEFVVTEAEAEVVFIPAADGSVGEMRLKQSGQNIKGTRVGAVPAPGKTAVANETPERKAINLDEKTLERYTGVYELDPNFTLTVTREGARLFAQATGQAKFEVFAESETTFFYTVTNAQITFGPTKAGKATALTLHQAGQNHSAKRRE